MKKHYVITILTLILGIVLIANSFAAVTQSADTGNGLWVTLMSGKSPVRPYLNLNGGVAIVQAGKTQTTSNIASNKFSYLPNQVNQLQAVYGVGLGVEIPFAEQRFAWQAGVMFNQITPMGVNGTLLSGPASASTAYNYSYKVNSQQILAQGKFSMRVWQCYHPYVSVAAGVANNSAYAYQASTTEANPNEPPYYSNHTTTVFAYGGGVGMDVDLMKHLRFGLGYQFLDLGNASLGQGSTFHGTVPYTVQSHIYANQILAQLTLIF